MHDAVKKRVAFYNTNSVVEFFRSILISQATDDRAPTGQLRSHSNQVSPWLTKLSRPMKTVAPVKKNDLNFLTYFVSSRIKNVVIPRPIPSFAADDQNLITLSIGCSLIRFSISTRALLAAFPTDRSRM